MLTVADSSEERERLEQAIAAARLAYQAAAAEARGKARTSDEARRAKTLKSELSDLEEQLAEHVAAEEGARQQKRRAEANDYTREIEAARETAEGALGEVPKIAAALAGAILTAGEMAQRLGAIEGASKAATLRHMKPSDREFVKCCHDLVDDGEIHVLLSSIFARYRLRGESADGEARNAAAAADAFAAHVRQYGDALQRAILRGLPSLPATTEPDSQ